MHLKKAQLVKAQNNQLWLIPLEEIKYGLIDFGNRHQSCEILKAAPKIHFWIYKKNVGYDVIGNENHIATPITEEEVQKIIFSNNGICYIETNSASEINSPSNNQGDRVILIHISIPEYVTATKETAEGFVYADTNEVCPFCEKENVTSGLYLQFNKIGHPCCNTCYNKTGFNEWFNECKNIREDIPKQLDWFVEMYYKRGLKPKEAIDDMLLII